MAPTDKTPCPKRRRSPARWSCSSCSAGETPGPGICSSSGRLPQLRKWARGRLPQWARSLADTQDLVQDAVMRALPKLESFEVRHPGALQSYLRQAVQNRIYDEVRKVGTHPDGDRAARRDAGRRRRRRSNRPSASKGSSAIENGAQDAQARGPRRHRGAHRAATELRRSRDRARQAQRQRCAHGGHPRTGPVDRGHAA